MTDAVDLLGRTDQELRLEIATQEKLIIKNKKRIEELDQMLEFYRNRLRVLEEEEDRKRHLVAERPE